MLFNDIVKCCFDYEKKTSGLHTKSLIPTSCFFHGTQKPYNIKFRNLKSLKVSNSDIREN